MMNKRILFPAVGIILGAVAGYLYYHFIGCYSGTCPLTSQPLPTTLYGAFTGGLVVNAFVGKGK
ncbi:MAG: DUF6132 family protein [Spirosomataceae bacterium]|jgi:hypothetical protein